MEKMSFNHFLPPKTMAFIVKLADEYNLSWKEVARILINKVAFELGLICEHRRIGRAKSDGKPYCKDCWTRFQIVKERVYSYETKHWSNLDKFIPLDTFIDEIEKRKNLQVKVERQVKVQNREEYV